MCIKINAFMFIIANCIACYLLSFIMTINVNVYFIMIINVGVYFIMIAI